MHTYGWMKGEDSRCAVTRFALSFPRLRFRITCYIRSYGGLFDHDLDHGVVSSMDEFVIFFFLGNFSYRLIIGIDR